MNFEERQKIAWIAPEPAGFIFKKNEGTVWISLDYGITWPYCIKGNDIDDIAIMNVQNGFHSPQHIYAIINGEIFRTEIPGLQTRDVKALYEKLMNMKYK